MREPLHIETINELKLWLEGRFDILNKVQDNNSEELKNVRKTVHEVANHVQVLISLNIPDKLDSLSAQIKKHEAELEELNRDNVARKSAVAAIKAAYSIGGAVIGSIITLAFELYQATH